jgi:hypothetical protein
MDPLAVFMKGLVVVEFLAAIAGFFTWSKWKNSNLKWFPFYLFVITALEFCFYLFYGMKKFDTAGFIKEIQVPIEILFINWFFFKTLTKKLRIIIPAGIIIYIVSLILELTWLKSNTYYFESLSATIGNLCILIYCIIYFIDLVNSDKILFFRKLTVFWLVTGMLVFYLGTFPYYGLYNELGKNENLFISISWVALSLNYCMYLLFTIAFIWGKPQ